MAASSSDRPLLVSSESSAYPDFKAYHRLAPDDRLPSKKNHIEQNFFILKRTKRNNRTEHIECQCAFCSISFKSFNSTQMRVHLTGENCIANRNSVGGSKFSKTEGLVRDRHSFWRWYLASKWIWWYFERSSVMVAKVSFIGKFCSPARGTRWSN